MKIDQVLLVSAGAIPNSSTGLPVRSVHWFGLRRSLLAKENRQHDDNADRKELALPILKGLKPERCASKMGERSGTVLPVQQLFPAIFPRAGDQVQNEGKNEQQE